jgi:hypothetical protein
VCRPLHRHVVQDMSSPGWVQERARQARWLAAALDIV